MVLPAEKTSLSDGATGCQTSLDMLGGGTSNSFFSTHRRPSGKYQTATPDETRRGRLALPFDSSRSANRQEDGGQVQMADKFSGRRDQGERYAQTKVDSYGTLRHT